jgi:hypothetical protein
MTPRCHHCGGELFTHDGERLCADCTAFRPADPPLDLVRLVGADPDLAQRDLERMAVGRMDPRGRAKA